MRNSKDEQKKCGMVTLYDDNYGTCLQAYALYVKIKEFGYEPTIIRYSRGEKQGNNVSGAKKKISRLMEISPKVLINYFFSYNMIRDRKTGFARFRDQFLTFTQTTNYRNDLDDSLAGAFDGYVCGSDMIWSEEFVEDWNYFFMQFVPKEKRISYAPSFGKNEISEQNHSLCDRLLREMKYLSCREEAGVAMIKREFGLEARQVLDPTLLMTKEEWDSIVKEKDRWIEEKYTLTYVFGGMGGTRLKIFEQIKEKRWGIHKVIPMNRSQYNRNAVKGVLGPIEFLRLYRNAEFIITDTFHGMIFALIYEKPFVVLEREDKGHWAKYSDRMTSTLKMLGLEERYINHNSNIPDSFKQIDYNKVGSILQQKREESLEYLKSSLAEVMCEYGR